MVRDTVHNGDIGKTVIVWNMEHHKVTGILENIHMDEYGSGEDWGYVENEFKVNGRWYSNVKIEED